jgi:hypothetical protein
VVADQRACVWKQIDKAKAWLEVPREDSHSVRVDILAHIEAVLKSAHKDKRGPGHGRSCD